MTPGQARQRRLALIMVPLLVVALVLAGILSLGVGAAPQPVGEVYRALADGARSLVTGVPYPSDGLHIIVLDIRLPRLVLAILVGLCLAVSGAIMQALFQNAMADPYLIGVSSGASLGAVVAMMLAAPLAWLGITAIPLFTFVGALLVVFMVYVLARRGGRVQSATLLLTGIALGSLVAALTSFLMLVMERDLRGVLFWLLGGLSGRSWPQVWLILPQAAVGLAAAIFLARPLNLLLMGEDVAFSMGLDTRRYRLLLLALASLLAAGAVAVSGIIAFVGLIIPHVARLIVGPDHRRLLPVCALSGALLLVLSDIVARWVLAPSELPLGIITSALGCPFFLYLLHHRGPRGL